MRITRFLDAAGQVRAGIDLGGGKAELLASPDALDPIESIGETAEIHQRLAPIAPRNIFCIGLNYREHARETGAELPEHPVIFMKPTSAVSPPGDDIVLPACAIRGPEVDYECELAVVIGKAGKDIRVPDALDHVLGYTVANDVSARRWQKHAGGSQWVRGKSFDSFCPLGPVLVTADEVEDPQTLQLRTTLNGETMQDSSTSDMIFTVAELIAFLSQDTTLLPGTVILTGTPAGVGVARKPRVFLTAGDEVTVEIDRIGKLTSKVREAGEK
ncbi:MAG: fumarylacetoacetate hydrolase family protein [Phycisphaeraceae bacterium]